MARSEVLFLSFTCEDIGVAMVTNMISQLQESFPLRHTAGSFEISFTKWLRGVKTAQLPAENPAEDQENVGKTLLKMLTKYTVRC